MSQELPISYPTKDYICPNCSSVANDHYCSRCGQKKIASKDGVRDLLKNLGGHYFHYDSKFWVTVSALLFKPGALTIAYAMGQRQRYLLPITLYIYVSVAYFLLPSLPADANAPFSFGIHVTDTPGKETQVIGIDQEQLSNTYWSDKLTKAIQSPAVLQQKFNEGLPKVFFLMIPVLALLLKAAFMRNRKYSYADHLVCALHIQSFAFLAGTGCSLLFLLGRWAPFMYYGSLFLFFFLMGSYCSLSLRKVYQVSWPGTLVTVFLVSAGYILALFALTLGALLVMIGLW